MSDTENSCPLKTRPQVLARRLARFFVKRNVAPNQMSLAGVAFAFLGALAFMASSIGNETIQAIALIAAAVLIQLRLLANMLDGLMAVEEGKKTSTGSLYKELPNRIADVLFLFAAGFATGWPSLGWLASLLAVLTAYVRALGGSLGVEQNFCGPMAKTHRMFALTAGSLLAAFMPRWPILALTLCVIIVGSVVTIARRTQHLARALNRSLHD